jgi:hypothetical protein
MTQHASSKPTSGLSSAASAAVSAFSKGGDLLSSAFGGGSKGSANGVDTTDPADVNRAEGDESADDVTIDSSVSSGGDDVDDGDDYDADDNLQLDVDDEEAGDESDEKSEDADDENKSASGVEEFEIGGKKYSVDFSKPEEKKKLVAQAVGMRKFQAERDQARAELAKVQESGKQDKQDADDFRKLSAAWEREGLDGLIKTLTGGKQTWDQVFDAERARRERIAKMSPAEKLAYEKEQEAATARAEKEKLADELNQTREQIKKEKEDADRSTLKGYMEPAFERARFAGKLGDETLEHELDEMLWEGTRAALSKLPDDVVLTPQLIRQEFARRAKALGRAIEKQSTKKTRETLTQKKAEAKEQAQLAMKSDAGAAKQSSRNRKIQAEAKKGNVLGAVMAALTKSKK